MADEREVFTILEDDLTGGGVKLPARSEGDTVAGNEIPVLPAKDNAGNYQHIPLDATGAVIVTSTSTPGVQQTDAGTITSSALNTDDTVAEITGLANSTTYECTLYSVSALKPTRWKLQLNDNGTPNTFETILTSSGQYSYQSDLKLSITTGAAGAQSIRVVGAQLRGPLSDKHATIKIVG
jgi:hypothetical protein